jgi:hypothetical protein
MGNLVTVDSRVEIPFLLAEADTNPLRKKAPSSSIELVAHSQR